MKHDKRQTWWKRRQSLSAGEAATFGAAVGLAAATAAALNPPGDFSFGFLVFLLLSLGPCGGIAGYMFWLVCDPVREQWLRTITIVVGLFFHIVLFITVPSFWRDLVRAMGPGMVGTFMGFIFAAAAFVVAAGLGIAHFVVSLCARCGATPQARVGCSGARSLGP